MQIYRFASWHFTCWADHLWVTCLSCSTSITDSHSRTHTHTHAPASHASPFPMMLLSHTKACLIGHLSMFFFFTLLSSHLASSTSLLPPLPLPPPFMPTNFKSPPCLQELSPSPQFIVNGATRLDVRQGKLSKCTAHVYTTCCFFWLAFEKEDYIKVKCQVEKNVFSASWVWRGPTSQDSSASKRKCWF